VPDDAPFPGRLQRQHAKQLLLCQDLLYQYSAAVLNCAGQSHPRSAEGIAAAAQVVAALQEQQQQHPGLVLGSPELLLLIRQPQEAAKDAAAAPGTDGTFIRIKCGGMWLRSVGLLCALLTGLKGAGMKLAECGDRGSTAVLALQGEHILPVLWMQGRQHCCGIQRIRTLACHSITGRASTILAG
jgi:hypothetical protein